MKALRTEIWGVVVVMAPLKWVRAFRTAFSDMGGRV